MARDVTSVSKYYAISIIGVLFFIFGFVTWLNATLIPYLKIACELTNLESLFVAFAFYVSYFVLALPSSWVLGKTGFKNGMSLGLIVMSIGSIIFIPAAMMRFYPLFLTGLFVQGAGLSILQTASNPYVTIIGPIESAAKRISIMGIANKIAGIISPLILGTIVLKDADTITDKITTMSLAQRTAELDLLSQRVIVPYIVIAVVLLILALLVKASKLPEIDKSGDSDKSGISRSSIFKYPYLWLGVLSIFLYVGAEVISVDTIINYGKSIGIKLETSRFFASFTLFAMVAGYLIGIAAIPRLISQSKALFYATALALVLTVLAVVTSGITSVIFIALLGLANAVMWPAIWPLSIEGLGKYTKTGSALLIMGIVGGATIPLLYGALSDLHPIGTHYAYLIIIPCYAFIMFFALKGHRYGK
ncbi:MAG: sugar MFS transporter [Bacteroidales bacterium]|nr:sugar MFS transporter [Bacteroidales bacterium]HQP04157.1 sugar MFS transporter [Bacteroidales bacterium]